MLNFYDYNQVWQVIPHHLAPEIYRILVSHNNTSDSISSHL